MPQGEVTKIYRRGSAATEICAELRREILTLELEPGAPLDETLLSKRFNVSRSPIREVLNRLLAERLVETLPNRGTVVASVDLMGFAHFIEALDIQQRYATRLAARNRTDDDLVMLRALSQKYSESVVTWSPFDILQSNFEFHVAIAKAGKNPYVVRQYSELLSEARRFLHIHIKFLQKTGRQKIMGDQHNDFVEAIEAHDVDAADAVAHAHSMQFHDRFLQVMHYVADDAFTLDFDATQAARAEKGQYPVSRIRQISVRTHCNDLGGKVWNPAIRWTKKYAVFVVLTDDDGNQGLGECWCFDTSPKALAAFLETEVAPHILGQPLDDITGIAAQMVDRATLTARHGILASAMSGIDIATWDLRAQRHGRPIWACLNSKGSAQVQLYGSGGLYGQDKSTSDLADEMASMARRFQIVKMKIGALTIAEDVARIQAVLDALPVATKLVIDGVYRYSADEALRLIDALPRERIEAFQSPVDADDFAGMAQMTRAGVPVMMTEAEYRDKIHRILVEDIGIAYLQTAPIACGGISRLEALKSLVQGTQTRLSLEVSSTAVALMAACQSAAADDSIAHVEHHFVHQVFFDHLALRDVPDAVGTYALPKRAGLGISLASNSTEEAFALVRLE